MGNLVNQNFDKKRNFFTIFNPTILLLENFVLNIFYSALDQRISKWLDISHKFGSLRVLKFYSGYASLKGFFILNSWGKNE